jgi:hypothetical protein
VPLFALCFFYLTQRGSGAAEGVPAVFGGVLAVLGVVHAVLGGVPAVLGAVLATSVVRLEAHSRACNIFKLLSRETTNHAHAGYGFAHLTTWQYI